jgi:hypothetical protein
MKKGTILTPRDVGLLSDCYHQVMLSISQIHLRHFPGLSLTTTKNRIGRLKAAGYLAVFPVAHVDEGRGCQRIGVVYQITTKAIRLLRINAPLENFRDEPVRLSPFILSHDLLLTDVMTVLKMRLPGYKIVHGKLVQGEEATRKRQPDAVLYSPDGRENIAIELELTSKSLRRYRDIILEYRLQSQYPKVLYITATRPIAEKIQTLIAHKPVPGLPAPSTGKFYFTLLQNLLKEPMTTPFSNGESILDESQSESMSHQNIILTPKSGPLA